MSWLQIGAIALIGAFVLVKLEAWKYVIPKRKSKELLQYTLEDCATLCDAVEDFKAWKRIVDLVNKHESN